MRNQFFSLTFFLLLISMGVRAQSYGSPTATISDLYVYDVPGESKMSINYTLSGCTGRRDYYYVELLFDPLLEGVLITPSEGAVSGTSLAYPVRCGRHQIVWDLSKEPVAKRGFLNGDVEVVVHTVDGAYVKYAKSFTRLEKRRLKALAKGKFRKANRLARRQSRRRAKNGIGQ